MLLEPRRFSLSTSGATAKRTALEECLRFVRQGDVLFVTKPDRLARSTADLLAIQTDLENVVSPWSSNRWGWTREATAAIRPLDCS